MKHKKHVYIQILIVLVMTIIATNQSIWIANMYNLHRQELKDYANESVQYSVLREIAERSEKLGGWSVYSSNLNTPGDSSRFFTKKVTTADSTYTFEIDKNDPHTMDKIVQFVLKSFMPVNLNTLDSLFREDITKRYKIGKTYFDYIDLEKDTLIDSNRPEKAATNYLCTDTIPLDIVKSIGVTGHIEVPDVVILRRMAYQLILSVILILTGIGSLIFLGKSFIAQWKTEKLRQSSVNSMTHEFKRPISGAVAMVATIPFYVEQNRLDKVTEYAGKTMTELNKLTAYTQRIQQISNNEKGKISLNKSLLEIVPFIDAIVEKYTDEKSKTVSIKAEYNTQKKYLSVDVLHFSNVIENLVENAIKYSGESVEIKIRVNDTPHGTNISVCDNGFGISASDKRFIFEKFYRSCESNVKNKTGFGLGLTYCKSIVEAHNGFINVESKLNKGSIFTVFLPDENDA